MVGGFKYIRPQLGNLLVFASVSKAYENMLTLIQLLRIYFKYVELMATMGELESPTSRVTV